MKFRIAALSVALSLGLALGAPAQTAAPEVVVLKAAHLFDGQSGRLVSPGVVVVSGGRIVAVGADAKPPVDANVRTIDLGEATLLPGYIDAHTHLASDHNEDWAQGFYENMLRFPTEQAFHAQRNAQAALAAGVTSARELGAPDFVDIGLRNAINSGLVQGPRLIAAGHALGSTGGHCDSVNAPPDRVRPAGPLEGVCNGAEECRLAVRQQMKFGADVIKICASGGVLSESDPVDVPQLTPEELRAIIGEAHNWNRKVAAHSHGDVAARLAVEAGVDSIEHGSFLTADTLQLMKRKGVYLVPTRMTQLWVDEKAGTYPPKIGEKARAAAAAHTRMFKQALQIGVPIAYGTDSAVFPHGLNAREFGDYVDMGMSPAQALMTSSQGSAKLLGIDGDTGTLEPGKAADIVAVPGDVLSDIRATERPLLVMRAGVVVKRPAGAN